MSFNLKQISFLRKFISVFLCLGLLLEPLAPLCAKSVSIPSSNVVFFPFVMRGLRFDPVQPLKFRFFFDAGQTQFPDVQMRQEAELLTKYFLAALTIPEKDLWVNLAPGEKNRVVSKMLGRTQMGQVMLEEDLQLKKLAAIEVARHMSQVSIGKDQTLVTGDLRPESEILSRIWIVPAYAKIVVSGQSAFVVDCHLRVEMKKDQNSPNPSLNKEGSLENLSYLNKVGRMKISPSFEKRGVRGVETTDDNQQTTAFLNKIETAVNTGSDFVALRQVFHSLILAVWYKKTLKENLLNRAYSNKNKTSGLETEGDWDAREVYKQYLAAMQEGVYSHIEETYDPQTQEIVSRKYIAGGVTAQAVASVIDAAMVDTVQNIQNSFKGPAMEATIELNPDVAMVGHRKPYQKFDLGKTVAWVIKEFVENDRTTWPTRDEFSKALGSNKMTFSNHMDEIMTAVEIEINQEGFEHEQKKKIETAMETWKNHFFNLNKTVAWVIKEFVENGRTTWPTGDEFSKALGPSQKTFSYHTDEIMTTVKRKINKDGFDPGLKKNILKAINNWKKAQVKKVQFDLNKTMAWVIKEFVENGRTTWPTGREFSKALGSTQTTFSSHMDEIMAAVEIEINQKGIESEQKKKIETAMETWKNRFLNLDKSVAWVIKEFVENGRTTWPTGDEFSKALGSNKKTFSNRMTEIMGAVEGEINQEGFEHEQKKKIETAMETWKNHFFNLNKTVAWVINEFVENGRTTWPTGREFSKALGSSQKTF